jgi:hypothetical protein
MTTPAIAVRRHAALVRTSAAAPVAAVAAVVTAAYAGRLISGNSPHLREFLALVVVILLGVIAANRPRHAVVAVFALLPFLALGRRLLIPFGGWRSHDPLLLVAPAVAIIVLAELGWSKRRSRLSTLVAAFLLIAVAEAANPSGSPKAGVVGLFFVVGPLLWFFVGRELADGRLVANILTVVVAAAVTISLYGLSQSEGHFTSWDNSWIAHVGYAALSLGAHSIRAFGTFSSAAEYGAYLAAALLVCIAAAMHGRMYALAATPLLGVALFLEGSRGVVVLTVAATIALVGLRTRRVGAAAVTIAIIVGALVLAWPKINSFAQSQSQQSGNVVVQHQVGGLTHPLNSRQSTLVAHWDLFLNGMKGVVTHPFGLGTGSTNLAGAQYGGAQQQTEVDVSNMFIGLGIIGGVLFVLIVLTTLRHAFAVYRTRSDVVGLAVLGILLVSIGQWLNGGFYALAPLIWLLAGWVEREWSAAQPQT